MGKNETFHIHVKSEPGYSPKYPEHVFSVIGLSLCRHSHDHKMRQITKCDGKDSWNCRNLWLSHFVTVQNATSQIHVRSARGYTAQCRKQCTHRRRTLSIRFPLQIHYGLYNWYTYKKTDITVKLCQNGQKWNFSYSCQKWTWVLSQVPRTRFQCYWIQFVPSRPWSQNATNHKMRRQGFLNCRNMCDCRILRRFKMQLLRFMSVVQEGILLSAGNMYTSTLDTINKISFVNRLWPL